MTRCRVCSKFGHPATRHQQACVICGGDAVVIQNLEDVDVAYRCANVVAHEKIRAGFGDPLLAAQGAPLVATRKKIDKNQLRLVE